MITRLSADEARNLRKADLRGDRLVKAASAAPTSWDAGRRSAKFVMSAQAPDRYGDVVVTDGIDVTHFEKNPQAFLQHNSSSFPIGQWQGLQKYLHAAPPRLQGTLQLAPAGGPIPEIDQAAWSIQHGMLRAASIGFLPNWDSVEKIVEKGVWTGGLMFNQAELLDLSGFRRRGKASQKASASSQTLPMGIIRRRETFASGSASSSSRRSSEDAMDHDPILEDQLARAGYAVISPEMHALAVSIELRISIGVDVPWHEYEAILFAIYASAYGDHHVARVTA
jgi:hypothetical protein